MAQTSWKGTKSTSWSTASNWTSGVPTTAVDAVIGDASFTGSYQPNITAQASCKSLTVGNGTKVCSLLVDKSFTVAGSLVIGANGSVSQSNASISLKGNWTNSGTYSANHVSSTIIMAGTTQSITGITTFKKLTVNAGSTTSLSNNISVTKSFSVSGVFDPTTYLVTLTGSSFSVGAGGTIKVKASALSSNYSLNPTLNVESTVDYASAAINQTVSALSYGTLRISGGLVKTLAANTTMLSSTATTGNINIVAGTLDLSSKTINRGTSVLGGNVTIANGAFLKIGGTNTFPTNYAASNLATTSTVEYNGTNQTVSNQPYGNLTLSSSSGSATKTMPGTAMVVANDFTSTLGLGTSVSFTAAANITVNGALTIGTSTSFSGASYSHTVAGNWVNNGTFTGSTSTIIISGTNKTIGGTSTTSFNNLSIAGLGITSSNATITVAGNLSTSGAGTFAHSTGTLTMSGASKSITGTDITLNNLTVSGSITSSSSIIVGGNLLVNGSFSASAGTINMNGTTKTISGSGSIAFNAFRAAGTVSTTNSFTLLSDLSGTGKLIATAGTVSFIGTSTFAGSHDLYNVTLNGPKLQLGASSVMGVANTFTLTSGSFDVTTTVPNTVNFNGTGSQNIPSTAYDNLTTSTGATKTAVGSLTVNNALTITSSTTFNSGSYSHTIKGNWVNNGTFIAGSSTIQMAGDNDTSLTGETTFNILTVNKSNAAHYVTLNNNISVPTLNMTTGELHTESNVVTITSTRTGNGIVLGTITRTHAFAASTAYAFEGPYNTISLTTITGSVSSITVTVHSSSVDDFPLDGSINRVYNYSITNTGSYVATLRLHYQDLELNGNSESTMMLYKYGTSWATNGKLSNSTADNWVENSSITDISGRWTISDSNTIAIWKGTTSSIWSTAGNWKSGIVPTSTDIIQIGTETFTNQPSITSAVTTKALTFGSVQAATLTLSSGGSLTINGNMRGDWNSDATHTVNVGGETLNVDGDVVLSNGTSARKIDLNIGTGVVDVSGTLTQSGGAAITFSGNGTLNIGDSFDYSSGTFTAGTGTVVYNGAGYQVVGSAISYYNLSFNKTGGSATFSSPVSINGNLTLSTGGVFNLNASLTVAGNVTINTGVTVNESTEAINVGGNWTRSGIYNSSLGTITFNGSGNQSIGSTTFYNMIVSKSGGTLTPSGNLSINGNLTVTAGTVDLLLYSINRSVVGGAVTLDAGATLKVGGASNFPSNFNTKTLSATSTVEYNGTAAQDIAQVNFGNLVLTSGGTLAKTLTGSTMVSGNLTIYSGATLNEGAYTLTLQGNLISSGGFIPGTGTVVLAGASKTLTGAINLNNLIITGSYSATAGSNLVIDGNVDLSGSYTNGVNSVSVAGDLNLSGFLSSDGITTYTGTRVQTIRLTGSIASPSLTSTVVFAGTVAPVLNSTATPTFVNVTISNTGIGGVAASVNWTVLGTFNVTAGSTFNGGSLTHTFYGSSFNNEGTVLSSGNFYFNPIPPYATLSTATLHLGSGSAFTSEGTVTFGGSRQIIFDTTPALFHNVMVSNSNASGVSPVGNWNVMEELTVNSGAKFNAGDTLRHTFRESLNIAGTFDGGTSKIIIDPIDSVYISGSGDITFHDVTIGGPVFALDDFSVSGSFVDNGSFYPAGSEISFTGSTASTIGGSVSSVPFETLIISKTPSATVTLAKGISGLNSLTISGGILADHGFAISEDQTLHGTLTVDASAKLKIDSLNTLPVFSNGYSFDATSTVEYAGTVQTIAQQLYGNLTLSNVGTKSLVIGTTQANTFTNTATLTMPEGSVLELTGDWINNGTLNALNASTVEFTGSSIQNINGTSVTSFQNILITNTADPGVRVQTNQKLIGVLNLGANVVFDPDGSSNTAVFTLLSSGDSPTIDAAIGPLPAGARIDGKVTVQRHMSREGVGYRLYRYISSPIQNASVASIQSKIPIVGSFSGTSICSGCGTWPTMYLYDESVITDNNSDNKIDLNDGYVRFPTSSSSEILQPGRGYAMYVWGNLLMSTSWEVRGNINAGNFTPVPLPVSYTSSGVNANDGWNLVGNPFPSTIDWDASSGWTKTNLESAIYIPDNSTSNWKFATWNGMIGTNGGSQHIATGQSFWIKADGIGTPVLTANENVKASGTQTTFFRKASLENILRITMVQGSASDETVIHFREDATVGFDKNADARKMLNAGFNLSSRINDGSLLVINSMPMLNCNASVKLSIDKVVSGTYQLNFKDIVTFTNGAIITLKDNFLNKTVTVVEGLSHTFSVTSNLASHGYGRFELQFGSQPVQDFSVATKTVCEGIDGAISLSNSQPSVLYSYSINGTVTAPIAGNGTLLSLIIDKQFLKVGQNVITTKGVSKSCSTLELKKEVSMKVIKTPDVSAQPVAGCGPSSLSLIATSSSGVSYNWFETETSVEPYSNHSTVFTTPLLTESKTYYVSVTGSTGCESSRKSVLAEVRKIPDVTISESNGVLTSSFAGENQWYRNNRLLNASLPVFVADSSGLYKVVVSENGCPGLAEIQVTVLHEPTDFSALGQSVCENMNAEVKIDNSQTTHIYQAVINEITIASVIGNGGAISIEIEHQYLKVGQNTIIIQSLNECCPQIELRKGVIIEVKKTPDISVTTVYGCGASSLSLRATSSSGVIFNWFGTEKATMPESNHASEFTTPVLTESKTYYVSTAESTGCESPRIAALAEIKKVPNVSITAETGLLIVNFSNDVQWYKNNSLIPNETSQSIQPDGPGLFKAVVAENGCSASAELQYDIVMESMDNVQQLSAVAYPNPVNTMLTIDAPDAIEQPVSALILNAIGQVIDETELHQVAGSKIGKFDMTHQLPGIYFVRVKNGESVTTIKVIKQ